MNGYFGYTTSIDSGHLWPLIVVVLFAAFGMVSNAQAAWTCSPDFSMSDPYAACAEFDEDAGVVGSGDPDLPINKGVSNAEATLYSYDQALSQASVWQSVPVSQKREFMFKLSALFEVLFSDGTF